MVKRLLGFLLAVGSEQRKLMNRFGRELIAVFLQRFLRSDLWHPSSDRDLTGRGEIKNRESLTPSNSPEGFESLSKITEGTIRLIK